MLTEEQIVRYSRHVLLPEVGGRGQRRLLEGSAHVVGAGLAAETALLYLAAAGVGRVGVDPALPGAVVDHARALNPEVWIGRAADGERVAPAEADGARAVTEGARAALRAILRLLEAR